MTTKQEDYWAGAAGGAYTERCPGDVTANEVLFRKALRRVFPWPRSVLELGAGSGANLKAFRRMHSNINVFGVELNPAACEAMAGAKIPHRAGSVLEFLGSQYDLVLTKGLLIHIAPADLPRAYATILASARRWILICEYFNPTPVEIEYRGLMGRLWKRDFASELLELNSHLRVADYGFVWRHDHFPQDNLTWFLLERI